MLQAELFLVSYSCVYIYPAASLLKIHVKHSNTAQQVYLSWADQKSGVLMRGSFTETWMKLWKSTRDVAATRAQKSKKLLPTLAPVSKWREQCNHTPQKLEPSKGMPFLPERYKSLRNYSSNKEVGEILLPPADCPSGFPLAESDRIPEITGAWMGSILRVPLTPLTRAEKGGETGRMKSK